MMKLNIQLFGSTNKTTNYNLSQYVGTDKPTYLGDYNSDMLKIDTAIKGVSDANISTDAKASLAKNTADTALANADTAMTDAENAETIGNSAIAKIGNLENLSTTDKSNLVNAINELLNDEKFEDEINLTEKVVFEGNPTINYNRVIIKFNKAKTKCLLTVETLCVYNTYVAAPKILIPLNDIINIINSKVFYGAGFVKVGYNPVITIDPIDITFNKDNNRIEFGYGDISTNIEYKSFVTEILFDLNGVVN